MKKSLFFIGVFAVSLACLTSCGNSSESTVKITTLFTSNATAEDTLIDNVTRFSGIGHSGQFAYRTDSVKQYAATSIYPIHDTLINSDLRVNINYWVKATNPVKGDGLALSLQDNATTFLWKTFDLANYGAKANEWINVVDSVDIHANQVLKSGLLLKFFGFNANKQAIIDFDDIYVTIKKIENSSED